MSESNKCFSCAKRLSLTDAIVGKCKCEHYFCIRHRLPEMHECTFDYHAVNKDKQTVKLKDIKVIYI